MRKRPSLESGPGSCRCQLTTARAWVLYSRLLMRVDYCQPSQLTPQLGGVFFWSKGKGRCRSAFSGGPHNGPIPYAPEE